MKKIIGFDITDKATKEKAVAEPHPDIDDKIVRSVVTVRFSDGREYPYYNDKFNLRVDDVVFVDGKLEGKPGRVTAVTTKFKVNLEFYKKVIAKPNLEFHGRFSKANNFMLCYDADALTTEQVKAWFFPPKDEEFAIGEGYTVPLGDITKCEDFSSSEFGKAIDLYNDGAVKFLRVSEGKGCAIVQGNAYHFVEFEYENGVVTNLLCDCIKPSLCSHAFAVCIALEQLLKNELINEDDVEFTALSFGTFFNAVTYECQEITI